MTIWIKKNLMRSQKNKIHLISGPRNISTALMYAFGNRKDCSVVDEPFYAYYLTEHPEMDHPGRAETLTSQSSEFAQVIEEVIGKEYPKDYVFFKNMAHHLDGADWRFLKELNNVFLIRNPAQLIASFAEVIPEPAMLDIGLKLEWEIFEYLCSDGQAPIVLDSNRVLEDPESVLRLLCDRLGLPFSDEMLSWQAGPRAEDGVWAPYWYANVHKSTGWQKQKTSSREFPQRLQTLLEEASVYYDKLFSFSL